MPVDKKKVSKHEDGIRLDKWFKNNYPDISGLAVQKAIRKGEVRVDGKRAKHNQPLLSGQMVRVPPFPDKALINSKKITGNKKVEIDNNEKSKFLSYVVYEDSDLMVINKPSGLAVQGGSGVKISVDDYIQQLSNDEFNYKLVHRIDRDTSGALLIAKNRKIADLLTSSFKNKNIEKIYWALVVGNLKEKNGVINLPLEKKRFGKEEKMVVSQNGKKSETRYLVVDQIGKMLSWVAMMPVTGRTHQLRVHMAAIGNPILGDGKYGGREAFIEGFADKLCLHSYAIKLPAQIIRSRSYITAQISDHFLDSFNKCGFSKEKLQIQEIEQYFS